MQALQTSLLGSISAGLFSSIERCKSNNQSFQPELAGTIRVTLETESAHLSSWASPMRSPSGPRM
jgi:hypothetical protein